MNVWAAELCELAWAREIRQFHLAGDAPSRTGCAHLSELLLAPGGCVGPLVSMQGVVDDLVWFRPLRPLASCVFCGCLLVTFLFVQY